jgi:cyclophilin family peptidyl-prolyl cis-trans isomerase
LIRRTWWAWRRTGGRAELAGDRSDKVGAVLRYGVVTTFLTSFTGPRWQLLTGLMVLAVVGLVAGDEPAAGKAVAVAPVVEIRTSMGLITLTLDAEKSPVTVANFLRYVTNGQYDGTVFHRVVSGYIIQGGGFAKQGERLVEKATGEPIKSEADNGLRNVEGTIAMARTDASDSATAQFFINCRDNEMLDQSVAAVGYAVFGRVTGGMEVVAQINAVSTGVREVVGRLGNGQERPMPLKGVPLSDVIIESVREVTAAAVPPAAGK